jgi:Holliday junction resolvase RusA-like endonuclease
MKPEPKPRMTRSDKWNQRDCVMRYRAFSDELRLRLGSFKLPAKIELTFYVPMYKSWSKKKLDRMNGKPHQQTPDIDNFIKAFLDALVSDDSYVYSVKAEKYWCLDGEERIIIEYEEK